MSRDATAWVYARSSLRLGARAVLLALAAECDTAGHVRMSTTEICRRTKLSARAVQYAKAACIRAGELKLLAEVPGGRSTFRVGPEWPLSASPRSGRVPVQHRQRIDSTPLHCRQAPENPSATPARFAAPPLQGSTPGGGDYRGGDRSIGDQIGSDQIITQNPREDETTMTTTTARPAPVQAEINAHLLLEALADAARAHPHLVPFGRVSATRPQNLAYATQLCAEFGSADPLIAQIPELLTVARKSERITSPLGLLRMLTGRAAADAARKHHTQQQAADDWGFHQTPDYTHQAGDVVLDIAGQEWEYVPDPHRPGQLTKVPRLPDRKTPVSGSA